MEIKPDILPGYYILKLAKMTVKIPFRISLSFNNKRLLQSNGMYKGSVPTI